jgi:autoinducer 2 (AI-2) kinase
MSYLLAIDAGTGSCRALLFSEKGEQVAVGQREWTHHEPPEAPGGQDFDVTGNWLLIAACVRDALGAAGLTGADVAAVAATSMREGVVLYDENGHELWACPNVDSRSAAEAAELIAEGAADRIYAIGGDWVSITTPARLRWLARHRPDVLARARGMGMLSDWIVTRLSGVLATEPSCGSSSGMFSLADRTWSYEIASICGIDPLVLPAVTDPGTVIGTLNRRAAAETGLREGTPVVAGGADTQLGLLGAGARPDEYTVVAGTFWQNTILLDRPLIDPATRLRTLCHALPGQWMLEGIGFYCGMSMRWFRDAFCQAETAAAQERGIDPYAVMEESAADVPPGSGGVLAIMSNLMNARHWTHATPSFLGFDLSDPAGSGRGTCVRAIEEAAAYVARGHRDIITELTGIAFTELVFTGGAAKGSLWPQIIADVTGAQVHVPVVTESSALGAAICAGVGAGIYGSLTDLESDLRARAATFAPDKAAVAAYDEAYATWQQVYRRMLDIVTTACSARCGGRQALRQNPRQRPWQNPGGTDHGRQRRPHGRRAIPVTCGRTAAREPAQGRRSAGLGHAKQTGEDLRARN